jgi:LPS sulfotransferase NodH
MYTHHKFDHEFSGDTRAEIAYVVCSTPRCGSSLLCEHLCNSGLAGAPTEFFDRESYDGFSKAWGATSFEDYIPKLVRKKTSPNGVFGFKIHWDQYVDFFSDRDLRAEFPNLRFILITRRDRLGQTISFSRAVQSGQWAHDHIVRNHELRFDYDQIVAFHHKIVREEQEWNRFFAANDIEPVRIVYEDLVKAPQKRVADILTAIGVAVPNGFRLLPATLKKQADGLSMWWRQRFHMRRLLDGLRERLGGDGTAKVYGVAYVEHDLPKRLPADAVYPARVTLQNEGNFV